MRLIKPIPEDSALHLASKTVVCGTICLLSGLSIWVIPVLAISSVFVYCIVRRPAVPADGDWELTARSKSTQCVKSCTGRRAQ